MPAPFETFPLMGKIHQIKGWRTGRRRRAGRTPQGADARRSTLSESSLSRRGGLLPLAAISLTFVLMLVAFALDLGFICMARVEAQNCADAAALAAAQQLYPDPHPQTAIKLPLQLPIYQPVRPYPNVAPAQTAAHFVASTNGIADRHSISVLETDVAFHIYDGGLTVGPPPTINLVDDLLDLLNLRTADQTFVNACQVTVRRDTLANGKLNLFFSPLTAQREHSMQAQAIAAVQRGYGMGPGDKMLPIAMDVTIWNALRFTNGEINAVTLKPLGVDLDAITLSGLLGNLPLLALLDRIIPLALSGSPINILDGFTWERGMTQVTPGPDGIVEAVLLADQLHVMNSLGILGKLLSVTKRIPSLFITLETGVGGTSPNAARLNEVIRNGLSASDIARISTTGDGQVWLPFAMKGYFEIPTECESALREIIGQPRFIPLYATIPGTVLNKVTDVLGASHTFQFVGWGAVVVTEVSLTGPVRFINVQPAIYARHSIRPAMGANAWRAQQQMSDGVYTTPCLIK